MHCVCIKKLQQAHTFVSPRKLGLSIFITLVVVGTGHIPLLFKYEFHEFRGDKEEVAYFVSLGSLNGQSEQIVSFTWLFIGYLLPIVIFVICMSIIISTLRSDAIRSRNAKKAVKRAVILVSVNLMLIFALQTPAKVCSFIALLCKIQDIHVRLKVQLVSSFADFLLVLHHGFNCFICCLIDSKQRKVVVNFVIKFYARPIRTDLLNSDSRQMA